jgi:hypothetical protein
LLILLAVTLIIVAGSVLNISYLKAGAVVLLVTFIYLACLITFISTQSRKSELDRCSQQGLWFVIAALPFCAVRAIYLLLAVFGSEKYDPVIGDWQFLAGLGFAMEVVIVIFLIIAGVTIRPLQGQSKDAARLPMARGENSTDASLENVRRIG